MFKVTDLVSLSRILALFVSLFYLSRGPLGWFAICDCFGLD